jgi:YbgC/YbaW family acyl-CoA thioester hydrolase
MSARPSPFDAELLRTQAEVLYAERRRVRFQDVDAASTIYFPRVLEYFADAYLGLLTAAGIDVPRMLKERTAAAPLRHAEADFLEPLFFGDEVEVEVVAAKLGRSSVSFGHRLKNAAGRAAAIGYTAHVFVDGKTFQPIEVPKELAVYLEAKGVVRGG